MTDLHATVASGAAVTWTINPATDFSISSDGEIQVLVSPDKEVSEG